MYYPKAKILSSQYTSGNDFILKSTQERYKGYYYATYDGRYFTGKEPNSSSLELSKVNQINNDSSFTPSFHYPKISDLDKQRGYITRYFTKRVNGDAGTINEVNLDTFIEASSQVLYNAITLDWKITGPLYDDLSNMNYPKYGVVDTNSRMLKLKEKDMPGISLYLKNLTQFYQEDKV